MDTARQEPVDPYETFAREEAADRGRLRASVCLAVLVHAALLVLPWPRGAPRDQVTLPPTAAIPFRLQSFRFLPPQPPPEPAAPKPVEEAPAPEEEAPPAEPQPPPTPSAELLVPPGPAGSLLPPQPVFTPPPPFPEELWRRGVGGEVVLTLVVDRFGEVAEVEHEEGPPELAALATGVVRRWTFLPASLDGQPITTAISVRLTFPQGFVPSRPADPG